MQLTLPDDRYRRLTGLILGAALGAALGIVTQFEDRIRLPGVSLYQPPLGPVGNVLLITAIGAAIGLLVSWMQNGLIGTAVAALISAVGLLAYNYARRGDSPVSGARYFFISIFLVAPIWGMIVPLAAAVRWAAGNLEEAHRDRIPVRSRLWRPALLLGVVLLVGVLAGYSARALALLADAHSLLQAGQQAASSVELPEALKAEAVGDFVARGQGPYRLSWEGSDIERYRIPRPGRNFDQHSVVVARFDNGWNLVCLYVVSGEMPLCKGLDSLPG